MDRGPLSARPGPPGADGVAGANGRTILSTSGAPSAGLGSNEDYALDVPNHMLYGPKAAGAWPAGVDLRGPNGLNGADATSLVAENTQTVDYTLVLGDSGKSVTMNAATGKAITIPPNSAVAFPIGTTIELCRYGAGALTITPGLGVTLPNRVQVAGTSSRTIANQMSSASIRKRATDEWVLVGDIA